MFNNQKKGKKICPEKEGIRHGMDDIVYGFLKRILNIL